MQNYYGQNAGFLFFWIVDDAEKEIRVRCAVGDGKDEGLVDCDFG